MKRRTKRNVREVIVSSRSWSPHHRRQQPSRAKRWQNAVAKVTSWSTAPRSGRIRTASPASSSTSATDTRSASRRNAGSASSTAGTPCSSHPAAEPRRHSCSPSSPRATRSRWPRARYFGTGVPVPRARALGLCVVEFDQTGTPPDGRRPRLARGAVESFPDDARPRGRSGASGTRRRRRHRRDARSICGRSSTASTSSCHSATKYLGGHDDVLLGAVVCKREDDAERLKEFRTASGHRRGARPVRPAPARARDARGAGPPADGVRDRAGTAPAGPSGRPDRALRRDRGSPLLRRRRRRRGPPRGDLAPADHERHQPGRSPLLLEARARWEGDRVPPGLLRLSVGPGAGRGPLGGSALQALEIPGSFPRARVRFRPPRANALAHSRQTRRPTVLRRTHPSHKGVTVAAPDTKKRRASSRAPATNRRAADDATVEIRRRTCRSCSRLSAQRGTGRPACGCL